MTDLPIDCPLCGAPKHEDIMKERTIIQRVWACGNDSYTPTIPLECDNRRLEREVRGLRHLAKEASNLIVVACGRPDWGGRANVWLETYIEYRDQVQRAEEPQDSKEERP